MRRETILSLLLCLLSSSAMAALYEWSPAASHHAAVVRVTTPSGPAGSGVYVVVDDLRFVLTAAHVTEGSQQARVTFPDGQTASGQCTPDRSRADVSAIMIGEVQGINPVQIATTEPTSQLEICGYGGPASRFRHFLCRVTDRGQKITTANGKVTQGDSGGPWFAGGELVGIQSTGAEAMGKIADFDIFTMCHSAKTGTIRDFAKRVHAKFCKAPS